MLKRDVANNNNPGWAEPTILIVDDHDVVRTALRHWLNRMFPDCRLLEARSGEEALTLALARPIDIILMDTTLPRMNGIEATQRILASRPQVQVVIMSFHEDHSYRTDAEMAGASAFVAKHLIPVELSSVLARLLSQPVNREGKA